MKKIVIISFSLLIAVLTSGCLAPPILFPKTGAHGFVVDQNGMGIAKAPLRAGWTPVRFFYMFAPSYDEMIETKDDGSWRFYARKIEHMGIRLLPKAGYEYFSQNDADSLVQLYGGQCPTNDFILRLRRIETAPNNPPQGMPRTLGTPGR